MLPLSYAIAGVSARWRCLCGGSEHDPAAASVELRVLAAAAPTAGAAADSWVHATLRVCKPALLERVWQRLHHRCFRRACRTAGFVLLTFSLASCMHACMHIHTYTWNLKARPFIEHTVPRVLDIAPIEYRWIHLVINLFLIFCPVPHTISSYDRRSLLRVVRDPGALHDERRRHQDGGGPRPGQNLVQCRQSLWQESTQLQQRVSI